jgi:hypothetical protein
MKLINEIFQKGIMLHLERWKETGDVQDLKIAEGFLVECIKQVEAQPKEVTLAKVIDINGASKPSLTPKFHRFQPVTWQDMPCTIAGVFPLDTFCVYDLITKHGAKIIGVYEGAIR